MVIMMDQVKYIGSIQHTSDTIQLMYKTEYYTYDTLRMLTRMLIGGILVVLALVVKMNRVAQCLLLLAGCCLVASKDFPAALRAGAALEDRKAALPLYLYTFYDKGLTMSGEGSMLLEYSRFERLIEDDSYLYLFLGRKSVCMMEKASVECGSAEELKSFVAQRTGLVWRRNRSVFAMNLADLRQAVRDRWGR